MIGFRGALRYTREPEVFRLELAALARVWDAGHRNLHVMLPFVRTARELEVCARLVAASGLRTARASSCGDGRGPVRALQPRAVCRAGVRGISIGSNDLAQLVLGADRDSEALADTFDERDPAVTAYLRELIAKARRLGLATSICGQAPSVHPEYADLLVEAGIDAVSVNLDAVAPAALSTPPSGASCSRTFPGRWRRLSLAGMHSTAADARREVEGRRGRPVERAEARARLQRVGHNRIAPMRPEPARELLWRQLSSPLIVVLIASGAIALALGEAADGAVVLAVVAANSVIGFVQEWKAGRAIQALAALVPGAGDGRARRARTQLDAELVVPGDIVELRPGERVPADARVLAARVLEVDESPLTGESAARRQGRRTRPRGGDRRRPGLDAPWRHPGHLGDRQRGRGEHRRADRARPHLGADAARGGSSRRR